MSQNNQSLYFNYGSPIYHQNKIGTDPSNSFFLELKGKKIYKVKVRNKIKYFIELYYYEHFVFVKFYPKLLENDPDKYKKVGVGLTIKEKRKLLMTCCDIVAKEMFRDSDQIFAFVAQIYERDNDKKRLTSKRFQWYVKQVATFFNNVDYEHFVFEPFNFYSLNKVSVPDLQQKIKWLFEQTELNVDLLNELITDEMKLELSKRFSQKG